MRRFFLGLAMIAALGLVPCQTRGNDRQIAQQIVDSLREHKEKGELKGINIDLEVENGTVFLKGHVANEEQEQLAIDAARHVDGVRQVYNDLEIIQPKETSTANSKNSSPVRPASNSAGKGIEKLTSLPSSTVAVRKAEPTDAATAADSSTTSRQLAERICERLKQEKDKGQLKGFSLDLEVDEGVAWLKGKVATPEQQNLVLDVVRRVPGVTKVVNGLTVTNPTKAPEQIAHEVIEKLQAKKDQGELKDFGLDVEVDQGIVWLSGYVASEEQKQLVLETARYVPGVIKVVNDLTISAPAVAVAKQPITQAETMSKTSPSRQVPAPPADGPEEQPVKRTVPGTLPLNDSPVGSSVARSALPARPLSKHQLPAFGPQPSVPAPTLATSGTNARSGQAPANPSRNAAASPRPTIKYVWVPATAPQSVTPTNAQIPLAFAPSPAANYQHVGGVAANPQPVALNPSIPGVGIAPARFDHPQLPQYAWPSYAPYPNYGAVTYPKQYSPMAWPYIGPFYPYPQVPLGWRKVTLEWDDGWWQLDFKSRH